MNVSPYRYFAVVGFHPMPYLAVLAAVTGVGLWTMVMSPGEMDSALGMLLFVQMFLASSGFLGRARRGHFDPLLASASVRTPVVIAHWVTSVAPGVFAWMVLVAAGAVLGSASTWSALVGRRACALAIVSAVAWTAGFALSRGAAGALWMAGLMAALLRRAELLGTATQLTSACTILRHAAVTAVCPFLLIGDRVPLAPESILAATCAAVIPLLWVWRLSPALDLYLMDRA